jgi:hypothetical protein
VTAVYSRPHAPLFTIDLDGSTVTIRRAPDREPPFDDERHPDDVEPISRFQRVLPFPPLHPPDRHRPAVPARSARRAAVPDPAELAHRILIGVVEVASRHRPISQLDGMLSSTVSSELGAGLVKAAKRYRKHRLSGATLGTLRASEPVDGVAEICATLRTPTRVRAVALRLEIRRGQWICTWLDLG